MAQPPDQAVQVVVRCRPLLRRELEAGGAPSCLCVTSPSSLVISDGDRDFPSTRSHTFTFDRIFGERASQQQVYDHAAKPVVEQVLGGFNATICAYGQTGSGKTHTMEGAPGDEGIIARAIREVFEHIAQRQGHAHKFLVRASYLQIYNEVVSDLLKEDRTHLAIREDERKGVYVEGLSEWIVRSPDEILSLMAAGARARATGATLLNEQSSRSHAVFTLVVEQSQQLQGDGEEGEGEGEGGRHRVLSAKLNLVDLAGSERVRESGARGARLKETQHINLSLSALGNVIAALTSGDGARSHVPYRDAKLTRLLEDSLGGNCKTTVIANLSPAPECFNESLSTLKFTQRAKRIKNRAHVNEDFDKRTLLRRYEKELARLRSALENQRQQVVSSQLEVLQNERLRARQNHEAAQRQLEGQLSALSEERQHKLSLKSQIRELEEQLIGGGGGTSSSSGGGAHAALRRQKEQADLVSRQSRLESDLIRNEGQPAVTAARSRLEECVRLLAQQRDIMEALTRKLEEREATIGWLHGKLEKYDVRQRGLLAELGVDLTRGADSAEAFLAAQEEKEKEERGGGERVRATPIAEGQGPREVTAAMLSGDDALGYAAVSPSIADGTPMRRSAWGPTAGTTGAPAGQHAEKADAARAAAQRVGALQRQHEEYRAQAEAALASQEEEMRRLAAETKMMEAASAARSGQQHADDDDAHVCEAKGMRHSAEGRAQAAKRAALQLSDQVVIASKEREALRAILQHKIKVLTESLVRISAEVGGSVKPLEAWDQVKGRVGTELSKLQYLVDAAINALRTPSAGAGAETTVRQRPTGDTQLEVQGGDARGAADTASDQRRLWRLAQETRVQNMLAAARKRGGAGAR